MHKSIRAKFLLLLLGVVAVALLGAVALRGLMILDFRAYLEGETEDRAYLIQADLESSYERNGEWGSDEQARDVLRALMMGFEMRLTNKEGGLVVDTENAIESASPLVRRRLRALTDRRVAGGTGSFVPYPLFLAGEKIGTLEVRELQSTGEAVFLQRSNRFLMLSVIVMGGLAIVLSILFSRRLTRPIKELARAASSIGRGDLKSRVAAREPDEMGDLGRTFNNMAKALETHESLRKKLIADVAHELRTPLGVIRGELEGMMDGLLPNDLERLQSLYEETGRLGRIVDGIEELNQAEAGVLSLRRRSVGVQALLRNILERFAPRADEGGIRLELECDPGRTVWADPERLSQIVVNLLDNALKATGRGGNIRLSVEDAENGSLITVRDSGKGIGPEDLPFVFERFYRGSGGGLGIGLTIVKELVDAHEGRVEVKSEAGRGTTFSLFFPAESYGGQA